MAAPGFWDRPDAARQIVEEVKTLKGWTLPYEDLRRRTDHALELADLLAQEDDPAIEAELAEEARQIDAGVSALSLKALMQDPEDALGALMTIHPGAGGTESQ